MTHETTIKINGVKIRFSFCTAAYYALSQKYECTLAEMFERGQKDWIGFYRDILFEAAACCPENPMDKIPTDPLAWIDLIDEKDARALETAQANSRILGKSIRGN